MKTMRVLLSAAMLALMMAACGTTSSLSKAEKAALVARQVDSLLSNRTFTIEVDWMRPLGGTPRHVTSNYELTLNGDQLDSYLPYIGEAYRLPYGTTKGLNFKGTVTDYNMKMTTSNRYVIEFNVANNEDVYHYRIDTFNNGKAIIDVIARDRDAISFDGMMKLPQ